MAAALSPLLSVATPHTIKPPATFANPDTALARFFLSFSLVKSEELILLNSKCRSSVLSSCLNCRIVSASIAWNCSCRFMLTPHQNPDLRRRGRTYLYHLPVARSQVQTIGSHLRSGADTINPRRGH